jgi:phosphoserine phosphatase
MDARDDVSRLDAEALGEILEVTRDLARPLDVETMLEKVIDAGRKVLDAERGSVFVYDAARDELVTKVATGTGELRLPADRGIVGECARTRSVINVPDCYADPRFNPDIDRQTGYRTRCLMAVPLVGHDDSLEGVLQVLNKKDGIFEAEDERIAKVLGAQCAVALQRMRFLEDLVEKERMERELAVARKIQMRVFPRTMPEVAGYDVSGWSRPADETGGDIFDVIGLPDGRLALLLGDATGHGIGPALSVTQVRAMLRMCVRFRADLDDAIRHINDQLADDLAANRFVTAFLGVLDPPSHRILYHSGGQAPILHFHAASGEAEWLKSSTQPLGIISGLPIGDARALDMAPGDIVALITDGIYEFEDPSQEQFGRDRLGEVIRRHQTDPLSGLIERIVEGTESFARGAPQADDMTILLVRRLPG